MRLKLTTVVVLSMLVSIESYAHSFLESLGRSIGQSTKKEVSKKIGSDPKSSKDLVRDSSDNNNEHVESKPAAGICAFAAILDIADMQSELGRAVSWGHINAIMSGSETYKFSAKKACTRAQVITYMHRALRLGCPTSLQLWQLPCRVM